MWAQDYTDVNHDLESVVWQWFGYLCTKMEQNKQLQQKINK